MRDAIPRFIGGSASASEAPAGGGKTFAVSREKGVAAAQRSDYIAPSTGAAPFV